MAPLVELAAQALLDVRRSSIFSTLCDLPLFRPTCPSHAHMAFVRMCFAGSKVNREKWNFTASCCSSSRQTDPC